MRNSVIFIIKEGAQRDHNFRHFRSFFNFSSFVVISTFYRFKTLPSGVKCISEISSNLGLFYPPAFHKNVTKTAILLLATGFWSLVSGFWSPDAGFCHHGHWCIGASKLKVPKMPKMS